MILLLYIIVDLVRNKSRNLVRRVFFYSFIFYMIIVAQFIIGDIAIPPIKDKIIYAQTVPFYFLWELSEMCRVNGLDFVVDWLFLNFLKLTLFNFNFTMLMPLGVYLVFLFKVKKVKVKKKTKAFLIIFLVSFAIETIKLSFAYFGLIREYFDIDRIIIKSLS